MANIAIADIKKLRELTGVGMQDAAKTLEETKGDLEKAQEILRKKGIAKASKKADRVAQQGIIDTYIHGGRVGVMVEVNCETDFVAKTDDFKTLTHDIALQIAATSPLYVKREDVPEEILSREREIIAEIVSNEGKPEAVAEKMISGRLEKFFEEICLLEQPSVKDPKTPIGDLIKGKVSKLGENIVVARFARFELGEKK